MSCYRVRGLSIALGNFTAGFPDLGCAGQTLGVPGARYYPTCTATGEVAWNHRPLRVRKRPPAVISTTSNSLGSSIFAAARELCDFQLSAL